MKTIKLLFPLLFMFTQIIALKVLTTTDDIKNWKGNSWIKLDIKDINGDCNYHNPSILLLIIYLELNAVTICGRFKTYHFLEHQQTLISVNGLVTLKNIF